MRVRLFGKTPDDKGTQLEKLTRRLLMRLGYRQIALNSVGSGGSEIDIRAEYPIPSFNVEGVVHLVGECKAFEATVGMPDWLKFLGKVYVEKIGKVGNVRGLFVALSGVNGNVAGAYDDLRSRDQSLELISGDNLVEQLTGEFKLPPVSSVLERLGRMTTDPLAAISLGYYESRVFWIAEFVNSTFAMLNGGSLDEDSSAETIELVSGHIQAAAYRDLSKEQITRDRLALARKHVLGQLLSHKDIHPPPQEHLLIAGLPVLLGEDIDKACMELRNEGKIYKQGVAFKLADTSDVSLRAAIIREIIAGVCNFSHLDTPEWEALIDDDLLAESLRVKDGLVIEGPDRVGLVQLMKWSPLGLLWALNPDQLLCGHRREVPVVGVEELMARIHVKYFRAQLLTFAIDDFRGTGYAAILRNRYGLRELEFARRGVFKSERGVELEISVSERNALALVDTGAMWNILWVDQAPEPWSVSTVRANYPESGRIVDEGGARSD